MYSNVRLMFAASLLVAGFSSPAASNALTDLFSRNAAPEEQPPPAAAAAPAKDECLAQPGRSAAQGQRWVYRYDGHRKCWFEATAEDTAAARKPARRLVARRSVTAPEPDSSAPRKPDDVADARAEMANAAPAPTPEPALTPKLTVVRTVRVTEAAAQVPPAPVLNQQAADQPVPDQPAPPRVDVEQLLAEAPAASSEVASAAPAPPVAVPAAKTAGIGEWMSSWLGELLIVLGGVALLASSLTFRRTLWPMRFLNAGTEPADMAHDGRHDPSFGERIPPRGAGWDELLHDDPRAAAPLADAARNRPPEPPAPPSKEALWEEGIGALAALAAPVSPEAFPQRRRAYRGAE